MAGFGDSASTTDVGYHLLMTITDTAAVVGAGALSLLMILEALLALGAPLGRFAWGGRHRVLPWSLRWASFASFFVLGFAAWMLLARAGLAPPGMEATVSRISVLVFAAYFTLGVAMNAASRSRPERLVMTPTAVVLATCFFVVAAGL